MERSGAPSGWSQYQYEQGSGYSSHLCSSHQSFLTSTGCRSGAGPVGACAGVIPSPLPQSGCHFDKDPNNKIVNNSLSARFSASVQHRTEIFARDGNAGPPISSRRFFTWFPPSHPSSSGWSCEVCSEEFHQSQALRVHFHQFHLNPHHLSQEDSRLFRLSNFLVKLNEDTEIKTEYPGLYRCHECFNVFNTSSSLKVHLQKHTRNLSPDSKTMVVAKMAPKIDKLSREDFEDVSPREKRPKTVKPKLKVASKILKKHKSKVKIKSLDTAIQQKRKSRKSKQLELLSEPSDEFNSDSDLDRDKEESRDYKQKNRTLVKRQKMATGVRNGDRNLMNGSETSYSSIKESENGSHESDHIVNGHILESIDNVLSHVKNEFLIPEDEINLIETMDENKSPRLDEGASEHSSVRSKKNKVKRVLESEQKRRLESVALKQLKKMKSTKKKAQAVSQLNGIKTSNEKLNRKRRRRKIKNGLNSDVKSKYRSPVKDKTSPKKMEMSASIKDTETGSSISNTIRKRPKSDKLWRLKIRDHSKASNLVQQIVQPASDFICLKCNQGFQSFSDLRSHKVDCKETKIYHMYRGSKNLNDIKKEIVDDNSQELFEYVTGAVTEIPETSFNNMHGKITDLKTEDAQKFSSSPLNEIGLVKLNYSGSWSVKDVWESGGWEPREDQLTWQQYELSSAISKQQQTEGLGANSEKGENGEGEVLQDAGVPLDHSSGKKVKTDVPFINIAPATPSITDLAHSLTRQLTTQIVSRKAPLITCASMDRTMVTKLAKLPWSEQRKVKDKFDATLVAKRTKRISVSGDTSSQAAGHSPGIRQSGVTSRLELKQVGRSVKYMKVGEREAQAQAKEREQKQQEDQPSLLEGKINGEWEIEHSFLCSVCGVEYDDVLEILHHKWESHPHCLVTHVSIKEGVIRPPALLYPQVGPSTIHLDPTATSPSTPPPLTCSKCSEEFPQLSEESQGQFHLHLLACGGVKEEESGKRRKRKRRGHGGGLKSTVRMIQKSNNAGNSRDGTDTEEQTPRKRIRATPKLVQSVPMVPTHTRTTRFKESKKKEARKMAAKERRSKAKIQRPARTQQESILVKDGKFRKKLDLDVDNSERQAVADVLEKVISKVEEVRGRRGRPRRTAGDKVKAGKRNQRERRLSVVRARQMDLYREQSSESEEETDEIERAETTNTEQKRSNRKGRHNNSDLDTKVMKIVKKSTPMIQTPTQPVSVRIENDDELMFLADLDRVAPYIESPVRGMSPSKNLTPIRGLSPLKTHKSGNASPGYSLSPIRLSKESSRSSSLSSLVDLLVDSDSSEEHTEPIIQSMNREDPSPKTASRSLKRLETNLVSNLLLPVSIEYDSKKRNNIQVAYRSKFQPARFVFPIELKISAIGRVEAGETQVAVARDLNINTATLAAWWLRRSEIKIKFEREIMMENGDDMESSTAIAMVKKIRWKEEKGLASQERDSSSSNDLERLSPSEIKLDSSKMKNRSTSLDNRLSLPLHVKAHALKQVIEGKTQAAIAKELGINPSTVAHWWAKKETILQRHESNKHSMENTDRETPITPDNLINHHSNGSSGENSNSAIEMDKKQERKNSLDGRSFPQEVKLSALKRLDAGKSKASVARELGIGVTTLGLWIRRRNNKEKLVPKQLNITSNKRSKDSIRPESKHVYPLELKVRAIGRIDSGEDTSSVADSLKVNINTVAAWWNRREKLLKKSKVAKLAISKVTTSLDDSTVQVTHEDENENKQNLDLKIRPPIKSVNHDEQSEVFEKCLEIVSPIKSEVSESNEEKPNIRGRRLNLSNNCQASPLATGRLYMPLEVKQSAIRRIEEGATQVVVARDLDMSLSTVASWWRKKDLILQNPTSDENKKVNNLLLKHKTEKDLKTNVSNAVSKQEIKENLVAKSGSENNTEHTIPSTKFEPAVSVREFAPSELEDVPSVTMTESNKTLDKSETPEIEKEPVTKEEDNKAMAIPKNNEEENLQNVEANCLKTDDLTTKDTKEVHTYVAKSSLFSCMKSAFNGRDCDILEVEEDHAKMMTVIKPIIIKDASELGIEASSNTKAQNSSGSSIEMFENTSKTNRGRSESVSDSANGHDENQSDSDNREIENMSKFIGVVAESDSKSSIREVKNEPESSQEAVKNVSDSMHTETNNTTEFASKDNLDSFKPSDSDLKHSNLNEICLVETNVENVVIDKVNVVTAEPILDSKLKTTVLPPLDDQVLPPTASASSEPIPSHSPPISWQHDTSSVKGSKKKSLDFLANSLMKKALARSQCQVSPLPPKPSQSLSPSSDHCQIVQESHVLSNAPQVQIVPPPSPPSPLPSPLPQSGLGLIVSSYCSSEDEL